MEKSSRIFKPDPHDPTLTKFRVFADLAPTELSAIVDHCAQVAFSADERIITSGEEGHCMYVVLEGAARVEADGIEIATIAEGDFFGEVSLVDDGPRSADVIAVSDCRLLVITRMTLGVLAGIEPSAAIHLLAAIGRSLVAKLRADNRRLRELILLGRAAP
jgi:CRP/FNR family transcriptional regulator, cyclic AMP receptor protein